MRRLAIATALSSVIACGGEPPAPPPPAVAVAATPPPAPPVATGPAAPAAPTSGAGFVTTGTVLKREANDSQKVDDGKGKQVSNWYATLSRGEKVTVLAEEQGDYVKATTSDNVSGWLKKTSVVAGPQITEATVVADTDAFDRPDLLAINAKKKLTAGALVFVLQRKEIFAEVNLSGSQTAWVVFDALTTDAAETSVARLLTKGRALKEKGSGGLDALVALGKTQFATAKLLPQLEALVAPATDSAAATGAPATPPAGATPGATTPSAAKTAEGAAATAPAPTAPKAATP